MSIAELLISIAEKIKGIKDNVLAAYDVIAVKGGEVPEEKSTENLPAAIASIQGFDVRSICDVDCVGEYVGTGSDITYVQGKITELIDTNTWERCSRRLPFWGLKKVRMNCKIITSGVERCLNNGYFKNSQNSSYTFNQLEEVEFPHLEWLDNNEGGTYASHCKFIVNIPIKKLYIPNLKGFTRFGLYYLGIAANCPLLEEIDLPSFVGGNMNTGSDIAAGFRNNPELRIIKLNGLENGDLKNCFNNSPKLIHFEIRDGFNAILNLSGSSGWSPTMALRTDTTADDYVDLREDMTMTNNLEQFLWNFQHYIADRVADRTGTSALTMTLTSAVYEALQTQEGQTILATLTNKNWTVAQA